MATKKKKSKHSKKSSLNKKRERLVTKLLFVVCGVLIICLVYLIMLQNGTFEPEHEVVSFYISDDCQLIMGSLVYEIQDEGDCKIKCANNCGIRDLKYYDSAFSSGNSTCNLCACSCK